MVDDTDARCNHVEHFMHNKVFFFFFKKKNRAVYEIVWKIIEQPDIPQMTT